MRRRRVTLALIIGRHLHRPRRKIPAIDATVEDLQRSHRLIVRDKMARLVDPHESVVAVLTDFAVLDAIDQERSVAGRSELSGVSVVYGERYSLAAEVITDHVGVAVIERL